MDNLKIGYFINHFPLKDNVTSKCIYPNYNCGGAENAAFYLAKEMANRGHDITIFTTSPTQKFFQEQWDNLKILRFGTCLNIGTSNISLEQFTTDINESFDIIHTHFDLVPGPLAGFRYAKKNRIPLIVTYHGDWVHSYGGIIRRFSVIIHNIFFTKKILDFATHIISPSKTYISKSKYLKKYKNKISVIPNGINLQDFEINYDKSECRNKIDLPTDKKIILFFGFLSPYKGPDILLKALPSVLSVIPDTVLVFAGKGAMRKDLEALSKELEVENNVIFVGYVDNIFKSLYYTASDVFILPSIMDTECYPLTILESMACGIPVIASEIGGIPDSVKKNENGFLVPPGEPEYLAKALIDLLNDERKKEKMGLNGKIRSKGFSWENIAIETELLYQQIMNRNNKNNLL